jgi:hypothetical protein
MGHFPEIGQFISTVAATAEKLLIDFKFKMVEVTRISEEIVSLGVAVTVLINKMKKRRSCEIVERECAGFATLDWLDQCKNWAGVVELAHNPLPFGAKLKKLPTDSMVTIIDLKKPHAKGILRWDIPVQLLDPKGLLLASTTVRQEFQLRNGILTFFKGGCELYAFDLEKI